MKKTFESIDLLFKIKDMLDKNEVFNTQTIRNSHWTVYNMLKDNNVIKTRRGAGNCVSLNIALEDLTVWRIFEITEPLIIEKYKDFELFIWLKNKLSKITVSELIQE